MKSLTLMILLAVAAICAAFLLSLSFYYECRGMGFSVPYCAFTHFIR